MFSAKNKNMIDKIEAIESLFNNDLDTNLIDGLVCIKLKMEVSLTGDIELFKELENGNG